MAGSPAMPQHGHLGAVLWPRSGHLYREDNSKRHLARKILVSDEIEFTQVYGAVPQHLPDSLLWLMFPAPVFGADDHNERLPVLRYKLGNPFRRILGHGRKTLLGCLELTNCHNTKKVRHSVLSVQNLKSACPLPQPSANSCAAARRRKMSARTAAKKSPSRSPTPNAPGSSREPMSFWPTLTANSPHRLCARLSFFSTAQRHRRLGATRFAPLSQGIRAVINPARPLNRQPVG